MTTYPPKAPDDAPDPRIFSAEGQTFLVGDTIFLRGLEDEDAVRASGWRDSPYPINAERAGELVKDRIENGRIGQRFLVACRRGDGLPVGSLTMSRWPGNAPDIDLRLYADPIFPDAERIRAETLGLIVGWGWAEGESPKFTVRFADDEAVIRRAAEELGMRRAALWREHRWHDGQWRDQVMYEALNPAWLGRMGDPGAGIDHAVAPDDAGRWRPRQHPTYGTLDGDPPTNAVMVGPRVYLRPMELSDAPNLAVTEMGETETFMDEGRFPFGAAGNRQWIRDLTKKDPPTSIRFAVCLRETGEHIGSNGLMGIAPIHRTAETESWFHSVPHRGSGYGSEAKQLLLAYAFERLGLHSVHSWVWGPNTRSAAALRKQGYRESGRQSWQGTKHGEVTFGYTFDFLAEEWREMTARSEAVRLGAAR